MNRPGWSLQLVVLVPVLALMVAAGAVLYLQVLRTVGEFADDSIRSNLESLARSAYELADREVDAQNRDGRGDDARFTREYQLNVAMRYESFARDEDIGLIIESGDGLDFYTGLDADEVEMIRSTAPSIGDERLQAIGESDVYTRSIDFPPWQWRILLVKDASAFVVLVDEVLFVYLVSALLLAVVSVLLVGWLQRVLVRPIRRIAEYFGQGRAPEYEGVKELEFLSNNIGTMMHSLSERSLHLQTTLQSMSDGITVFDSGMRLVTWNPQFSRLYRYPESQLHVGLAFSDMMRLIVERDDDGSGNSQHRLEEAVDRARNLDPPRFDIDHSDGTSVEVRRAAMPDGGFVTTYTDITDRKRAERQTLARREAEAASEAKSQFLRNMSHDLRKPINAIIEFTRLVIDRSRDLLPDRQRRNMDNIDVSARHLLEMIDGLLEMARIEAGQIVVRPETILVKPMLESCLSVIEPTAQAKGLELSCVTDSNLRITTDPMLLKRIVVNLCDNATQYTQSGSIDVTAIERAGNLEIEVHDTGIGIEADEIERIRQKFYRVEATSGITKSGTGLGLGLAISDELARLLGGEITLHSQPGKGSTFKLTIPLPGPPPPDNPPDPD